jgi:hypothetical protein
MLVMIADTRLSLTSNLLSYPAEYRRLTRYTWRTIDVRVEGNQYPDPTEQRVPRARWKRNRPRTGEFLPEQPGEDVIVA